MLTFLEGTEELYRETNEVERYEHDSRGHFQFRYKSSGEDICYSFWKIALSLMFLV